MLLSQAFESPCTQPAASPAPPADWGAAPSLDLFPLLDLSLRRQLAPSERVIVPDRVGVEDRAAVYPMVPAPAAVQSSLAFCALVLGVFGWRFVRCGRLTAR